MVKLAFYEEKEGKKEMRINAYHKKVYLYWQLLWTFIWVTLAYAIVIFFGGFGLLNLALSELTRTQIIASLLFIGVSYPSVLLTYIIRMRMRYKKKHAQAHHNVKRFRKDLAELERMYEKEDYHGENI